MKQWLLALSVSFLPILPASAQGFGNVPTGPSAPSFIQPFDQTWDPGGYANVEDIILLSDGSIGVTGEQGFLSNGVRMFVGANDQSGTYFGRFDANGESLNFANFTSAKGVLEKILGNALVEATNGDVYIGAHERVGDLSQPVLLKVTKEGQQVWRKALAGPSSQQPYALHPTADGGCILFAEKHVYMAGPTPDNQTWVAKISPDGEIEGQSIFDGGSTAMMPTSDGGFMLTSGTQLLKLNSSGIEEFRTDLSGGGKRRSIYQVAAVGDGGVTLATLSKKNRGYLGEVIRFAPDGSELWSHNVDLGHATFMSAVVAGADGTVYVGGNYRKKDGAPNQPFITRISADGQTDSTWIFPGHNESFLETLLLVEPGIILAGGHADEKLHMPSGQKSFMTAKAWLTAVSLDSF